jgi:hypothetical protein
MVIAGSPPEAELSVKIIEIAKPAYTALKCILFDLEEVVASIF